MTTLLLKNNFSRGEFSPKALSRVDLQMYAGGAEELSNFVSTPHGGIRRRSGTKFIGYPNAPTGNMVFWEFVYSSTGDAYIIELGYDDSPGVHTCYFRFWTENGFLSDNTKSINGISQASPAVVNAVGHGMQANDYVYIEGARGMTEINNRQFKVKAVIDADHFSLKDARTGADIDSTGYAFQSTIGLDGGVVSRPLNININFTIDELKDAQYVQVGNAIYIAHQNYPPRKLQRVDASSWTLDDVNFVDGPWQTINGTDATMSISTNVDIVEGSTYTVNLSDPSVLDNGGFYNSDTGRHLRIKMTKAAGGGAPSSTANPPTFAYWASGVITGRNSLSQVTWRCDRVLNPVADTNIAGRMYSGSGGQASKSWRLGAFSDTTGYPKCVEVFEGRLVWANTPTDSRTLFFSRSGLPADYAPSDADSTVTAQHGFNVDVLAGRVDQILWLKDAPRLQVGTSSGVRTIGGTDTGQATSPTNVSQKLEVDIGASNKLMPLSVGNQRLYANRFGVAIHQLKYDFNTNGLVAPNISRLHDHLINSGIQRFAYAQSPEPIVWILNNDGTVVAVPFDSDENIISYDPMDFGGTVVAIGSVPGTSRDYVLMAIDRDIGGVTTRFIEKIEADFNPLSDELVDAYFVDCGSVYNGTPTSTVSGLWWLRGLEVSVLADGSAKEGLVVSDHGILTLPGGMTASKVSVGLPFASEFKTLRPPVQADDGFIIGRKQRAINVYVEVLRTGELDIGIDDGLTYPIKNRSGSTPFGTPPDLNGGTYFCALSDSWHGGQVYGSVTKPHPCFLRSLLITHDVEHA